MTDLAEELLAGLLNDSYECMICMNNVRRRQSIWHCEECYALFHLDCISKWSKNSLEEARQVPQGILPQKPPADGWRCPHCNKTHRQHEGPPVSRCFCGKYANPEFNPYITPHSCGDLCGRMRAGTDCPHPCNLPCHPGPCPPCSATGPVKYCWCGNEEYRTRCGETDPGRSCGELCDRPLNCRKHRCEEPCHPGPCQKCTKQLPMKCYCGKTEEERTCGTEVEDKASGETRHFTCGSICGQKLACGNHTCQRVCHTGPCDECALLPKRVKKCACGKTDILFLVAPRTSCLDPIPTCTKKCEKKLHCGVHSCTKNCHVGDCPPCKGTVDMPCRCKLNTKRIPCLQAFPLNATDSTDKAPVLCDVACSVTRSCGRHRCNTKCCTAAGDPLADEHICKIPCNKPLKCGKHRCGRLCHKGRCPPCLEASFDELACHCGKTVMVPPIPCSTPPPECNHPCVRPSPCGHALPYHACHRDNEPCPPCTVLVEKWCMGNHELRNHVPCHVKDVSCGSPCGKPMPCGQHKCARICHKAPCVVPKEAETAASSSKDKNKKGKKNKEKEKEQDEPAWEETEEKQSEAEPELVSCGQKCGRPLKHCAHNCTALCHPGQPCPVVQCRQMVRITCPCKRRSMEVLCLRGGPAAEHDAGKEKDEDDSFDASKREDKRQLSCDEMCEREKRNQRIDEAFNVAGSKEKEAPVFTEELLSAARNNTVKFVQKVEEEFKKLILAPSGIRHSFPPMKVLQRALIHELARWYRLDAISYDPEPLRNVVVMKKNDSRIPPFALLSTLMASGRLPKVATTAPALGSAFDMDIGDATDCVLQIYNLSPIITTEHLATFLSRFSGEYVLKWLDDANALAIFSNVQQYQAALSSLQTDGTFKIRPYEGPKTSWLRSRTMVKGESASSSSTSSSSTSSSSTTAAKDSKPAKKTTDTTTIAGAKPSLPPGLAAPASFAAPNAFSVLLSSPAASVDGVTPDDVPSSDVGAEAAPADWEELADDAQTDDARPAAATKASTPNVWNAVVASHADEPQPRGPHHAAAAPSAQQWSCAHCTFLNPPSAGKCEVCENTRF